MPVDFSASVSLDFKSNLTDATKNIKKSFGDISKSAKTMNKTLKESTKRFVKIAKDIKDKVAKQFKKVTKIVKTFSKALAKTAFNGFKIGLASIGVITGLAGAGLVAFSKKILDLADRIDKMSKAMAVSREFYQRYSLAAKQGGLTTDQADSAMMKFSDTLGKAKNPMSQQRKIFDEMGISVGSVEETLPKVLKVIGDLADTDLRKGQFISLLFGETGRRAFELFGGGVENFEKAMARLNKPLSDELIDSAVKLNDTIAEMKVNLMGAGNALQPLFEDLNTGLTNFQEWAKESEDLKDVFKEISNLMETTLKSIKEIFKEIGGSDSALKPIISLLKYLSEVIDGISVLVDVISSAIKFIVKFSPLTAIGWTPKRIGDVLSWTSPLSLTTKGAGFATEKILAKQNKTPYGVKVITPEEITRREVERSARKMARRQFEPDTPEYEKARQSYISMFEAMAASGRGNDDIVEAINNQTNELRENKIRRVIDKLPPGWIWGQGPLRDIVMEGYEN